MTPYLHLWVKKCANHLLYHTVMVGLWLLWVAILDFYVTWTSGSNELLFIQSVSLDLVGKDNLITPLAQIVSKLLLLYLLYSGIMVRLWLLWAAILDFCMTKTFDSHKFLLI